MELFKLNDKIELKLEGEDDKTAGFIYDIKGEDILVSISADDEKFKLLRVGERVRAFVYNKDKVISFLAKVTGRISDETSVYRLSELRAFNKIQRRENIRVELTEELLYADHRILGNLNIKDIKPGKLLARIQEYLKEGLILDLSGGGLKFSTKESFPIGKNLILAFELEEEKIILKGRIVHKDINLIPKNTVYKYGVEFIGIEAKQQEKIIKFLFVVMRKNRME